MFEPELAPARTGWHEAAVSTAPSRNGNGNGRRLGGAVAGLGAALPGTVKTNAPIAKRLGVSEDWITRRTGVRERRVADPDVTLPDLAAEAGQAALDDAGYAAADLDLVLVATCSFDMLCPAAGPLVADRLGAARAGAFDLNAACTGFLAAFSMATGQIESGRCRSALVIGAELMHRVIDHDDRSTAGIFADGAGAVLMTATPGPGGIGPIVLGADGGNGGLVEATRAEAIIRMNGHDTFRQAVDRLAESTLEAAEAAGTAVEEIDLFAYHQANSRIIEALGERLGLDPARVIDCVPKYGNTSSASVPIALAEARGEGRLKPGDTVLLGAFGGGLTWGAGVMRWGRA